MKSTRTIYDREIELFERTKGLPHPVGIDLLVNGLGCRQTEAEWSFDYLYEHSTETTIAGGTRSTTVRTVDGEILVPRSSTAPERRTWQTFSPLFRRSISRRLHLTSTAATKKPSSHNFVMHRTSSQRVDWITDSRVCSAGSPPHSVEILHGGYQQPDRPVSPSRDPENAAPSAVVEGPAEPHIQSSRAHCIRVPNAA